MKNIKPRTIIVKAEMVHLLIGKIEDIAKKHVSSDVEAMYSQDGTEFGFWATDKQVIDMVEELKTKSYEMEIEVI